MTETWTAPPVDRRPEPGANDERTMLDDQLEFARESLLMKCAGLDAAALRTRSVSPSSLSLLGLVRHMADIERWWFRIHVNSEQLSHLYITAENPDGEFDDVDAADAEADFATYLEEVAAVRSVVQDRSLDDTFTTASRGERTLRWVYLHMIEEYARHNGHADLLRERIDGVTGR